MENFAMMVKSFFPLTIVADLTNLDISGGPCYASEFKT